MNEVKVSPRITDASADTDLVRPNVSYGDKDMALANEILRTEVGSGVHGMAITGTDDHDEMGIFIEPADVVLGMARRNDQHVSRTKPEGVPSEAGDTDLTIYSLRKWMRLAVNGHPTIILPLYAPRNSILLTSALGEELIELRDSIISQQAGHRFLGYLDQQRLRLLGGGRRNRVPNRPELIEAYGYDTKYASHALRLGFQGIEVMTQGCLSLPLRPLARDVCLSVKRGEVPLERAVELIDANLATLHVLVDDKRSPLPEWPDLDEVNSWMVHAHQTWWSRS